MSCKHPGCGRVGCRILAHALYEPEKPAKGVNRIVRELNESARDITSVSTPKLTSVTQSPRTPSTQATHTVRTVDTQSLRTPSEMTTGEIEAEIEANDERNTDLRLERRKRLARDRVKQWRAEHAQG